MLVLSRRKNESIVIDDTIIITVVDIRADKVRVGIQAPKDAQVHRSESSPPTAPFKESPNTTGPIRVTDDDWKAAYHHLLDRLIDVEREKRALEKALAAKTDGREGER